MFSLGWNIWSKFIYPKPKLFVSASFVLFEAGLQRIHYFPRTMGNLDRVDTLELSLPAISITIVNHGPGEVRIGTPVFARRPPYDPKKQGYALFNEFESYPWQMLRDEDAATFKEPLRYGDKRTFYVPLTTGEFDEWRIASIGFVDVLKRKHFCARSDIETINEVARRYFSKVAP